ncbi:unnamed protein product [Hyaloperonospora brassicae]|uniref:MADF domain-containing protein n=1 Tax=Hyaloperonospora brassicae TaxID=162125 RepID=A0AAV0TGG1_HYABA|nr:unnamed protein product [Hyaloperonospora brassicae]
MSDFTDDEDRQLVQLALQFLRSRRQILWDTLTQQMKGTKKPKEALRQRLKTLKRTHGRDLGNFPAWFFRKKFAMEVKRNRAKVHRKTAIHNRDKLAPTCESKYIPRRGARCETEVALQLNEKASIEISREHVGSSTLKMATCFSKCAKAKPPASLLLLASVAAFEPLQSHKNPTLTSFRA